MLLDFCDEYFIQFTFLLVQTHKILDKKTGIQKLSIKSVFIDLLSKENK